MAIGHYEDKFSLTDSGLPAIGAIYTVKNTGTNVGATLTDSSGASLGRSTFVTDGRGNGGFYASDAIGYDLYDGGGTQILTDIRVVDIGAGGGALSYSSSVPADTTTGTAAVGTSTTGAPHADHTHHIGAHATTHNSGGSDAVTVAQSQVTGLATALAALLPLAGGTLTGALSGTSATWSGEAKAADFSVTGLTGAVTASRYVGATASGAPSTGTFLAGDWVLDLSGPTIRACTTGGTPGTWTALTAGAPTTIDGGSA